MYAEAYRQAFERGREAAVDNQKLINKLQEFGYHVHPDGRLIFDTEQLPKEVKTVASELKQGTSIVHSAYATMHKIVTDLNKIQNGLGVALETLYFNYAVKSFINKPQSASTAFDANHFLLHSESSEYDYLCDEYDHLEGFTSMSSATSVQAKKLGLTYAQFGRWTDKTGKVTHMSVDGKLLKIREAQKIKKATQAVRHLARQHRRIIDSTVAQIKRHIGTGTLKDMTDLEKKAWLKKRYLKAKQDLAHISEKASKIHATLEKHDPAHSAKLGEYIGKMDRSLYDAKVNK